MVTLTITDVRVLPGDSAFLIDDGKTAILYDSGFGFTAEAVTENIRKILGGRPVDYILLTHSHYDHALGSAYVKRVYPNAKVVAAAHAAQVFQKPSARAVMTQLDRKVAQQNGVTEYEDLADSLTVDVTVADGDVIACGAMEFKVVALPGHTQCSVGFYLKENRLLLGTETLGVYFGEGIYLPSCLVGYQLTLDAYRKVRQLELDSMLLPHYGIVGKEEAMAYLDNSEGVCRETARIVAQQLHMGKGREEIAEYLTQLLYKDNVVPTYPVDAFRLNTSIMIGLIERELC